VKRAKLIIAASESNADILYATRFRAPDAFVLLEIDGRKTLLLSDLEIDRGRRDAQVDEVLSYSALEKEIQGKKKARPSIAQVVARFLKARRITRVEVPADFSHLIATSLQKEGVKTIPASSTLWPERVIKTPEEIKALTAANRIAEAGLARAEEILRASEIRKDHKLLWSGKVLTSEMLRTEMEIAVVRAGGEARGDTIVACGDAACDPHERGHGPLLAHQLIILDIFPRAAGSGYYGDITRTVLRGRAGDAQLRIWETCLAAQKFALKAIRPGVAGIEIHNGIKTYFAEQGYPTEIRDGRWHGFFHGTGHGLGLEIHEEPRFAAATFQPGQVFTVEPGIYWPGVGGVRHEDVVVVTETGCKLLTKYPKPFELA